MASICIAASAQVAPSVWPKFRGNLANTGVGTGFSATNKVLWSQSVSSGTFSPSSPVVAVDGTVYVGSGANNSMVALDGKTGKILWTASTSGAVTGSAVVQQDGSVCFGSEDGVLYCVDGATGTLKWSVTTGGSITGSPTVDSSGVLYVGSEDRKLYAVDGATGKVKWTFPGGAQFTSSPALGADGTLYIGCNDSSLYALNSADGSIKWFFVAGGPIRGAPAIAANGTVVVGSEDQNLYGLRGSTGKVLWKYVTNGQINTSPGISPSGTVVVGSVDGFVYGIRAVDGAKQWAFPTGGGVESSASFSNSGLIYIGSDDGYVYCLKSTGALAWKYSTGRPVQSSPTPGADGTMYVGSLDGNLYAFTTTYPGPRPTGLSVAPATIPAGMPCIGTVTLDNPALYGGATLKVASSQLFAVVPSTVTVPYGSNTTTFPIATSTTGTNSSVKITCTCNGQSATAVLTIGPPRLDTIVIDPGSVLGGTQAHCTVTLSSTARAGGVVVSLSSNNSAVVPPSAITVPSGQSSTTFSIRTLGVSQDKVGKVTATAGGHSASAMLTVSAAALSSIQLQPQSVVGGQSVNGIVTLNGPAPSGGATVRLHATVAYLVPPSVVIIPAGKSSATFIAKTVSVAAPQTVTLSASYLTGQQHCSLGIDPPQLLSVVLKPATVKGGASSIATVTISAAAPSGGLYLKASSSASQAAVPVNIFVPSGRTSAQFTVKTTKTGTSGGSTITLSFLGVSVSAFLSITP